MDDIQWNEVSDGVLSSLEKPVLCGSTGRRCRALNDLHEKIAGSQLQLYPASSRGIFHLLFRTYPVYIDRASRRAVQQCLRDILPALDLGYVAGVLQIEGSNPDNAFVLVEWCSILLQHIQREDGQQHAAGEKDAVDYREVVGQVLETMAAALEMCLRPSAKPGLKESSLRISRRGLRAAFSSSAGGEELLRESIRRLMKDPKNVPFLGVIAGVAARIPQIRPAMEEMKVTVLRFYAKEIIGSRTAVPLHIASGLSDLFKSFITEEDLQNEIWPPLEKAMLRSPEVVFSGLIPALSSAIPETVDLSGVLASRLCKPLVASIKSANATVRNGAAEAFTNLLRRSNDESHLLKVTDEVVIPLKTHKITNAEQRSLHSQILLAIPCFGDLSQTVVAGLSPVFGRESSEAALESEINAFCHHLACLLRSDIEVPKDQLAVIVKGCGDKRIPFRKSWLVNFGELLWDADYNSLASPTFVSECLKPVLTALKANFDEICANPLPSAQSGAVPIAYVLVALSERAFKGNTDGSMPRVSLDDITRQSLMLSPKPSFMLNHRVYTKLTSGDDILWNIRALSTVCKAAGFGSADSPTRNAWTSALIFTVCSSNTPPKIREEALKALSDCYLYNPSLVGTAIIDAMWQWLHAIDFADKDSAAVLSATGNSRLHPIIKAITRDTTALQETEADVAKRQLIHLLVLCRPELVPGPNWIETVLKTGIDPGELVREYPEESMKEILRSTEDDLRREVSQGRIAAWNAAADLAFIAPDCFVPRIVAQLERDLDVSRVQNLGPDDVAIARTPEGITFIDVLSAKPRQVVSKSGKDHDTLKWEEELRADLAKKRGQQQKKLTPEEQAKVNTQLAKEAEIRRRVLADEEILKRGAGIVHSLARGPPIDSDGWINPAVNLLCALARAGAGILVGDAIANAYVACSYRVSSRLGDIRPFIGIATLRIFGETYLRSELQSESLGSLITRVLYRLRLASEPRAFDMPSLAYMLPLIFNVLERDGIDETEDHHGEQVLLALEILSFHTDLFSDARLPRRQTLQILLASMTKYAQHYKLIRDTVHDFCRASSLNLQQDELKVLLDGAIAPDVSVRKAVLQAILSEIDLTDLDFSEHIWLGCHDHVEENAEISNAIWEDNALEVDEKSADLILPSIESKDGQLRGAAARALAHACEFSPDVFAAILRKLESRYQEEVRPKAPETDAYGMPKKQAPVDNWETRSGIALAFRAMSQGFAADQTVQCLRFLITEGPLVDRNPSVRRQMADAGTAVISLRGQDRVEELMQLFEQTLETSDKATEQSDWLNEAVIVFYGSLARHLKSGDERLQTVIRKLLEALKTPSETVQYAVSECLTPLIRISNAEIGTYIQEMLDQLLQSKQYASRRGAAYGLAGIVNGRGISTLREFRIMAKLSDALGNKKDQNARQGAIMAFELFSVILGRIFEPYTIQIVPQLLTSFGDPSIEVRSACLDAAKACFANLSSYGVKQILPTLLEGLDEPQWRSKKGACDLLGAMAYLDPQQLAASLPDIIPPLTIVLNDSHKEVRTAANRSLQRFGDVISNPEVKGLVGILLKALSDPTKYTDEALDALIKVSFIHYLDAPSLALIVRILERGLADRSTTKRKSAQIIGSLAHLTERKDLITHLPILVAGLKVAMVDPVPTTRATASKALGSLIEKLGEDTLPDLIPNLMSTLKSETGAGDRLGSAQALSEVLAGLGTTRLEETLPSILQNVSSKKAAVREGFMSLFIFLPACFGNSFASYLSKIIPPILAGLADEVDTIRETALRAGRLLVKNFATKSIDLLLPELERGLADDNYRIRLSSVELVGDLLFNLTGVSTSDADEEDAGDTAARAGQSLLEVLGEERRNKVLSALYICRCDTSGLVRTAAIGVWKVLVASPRTLKDLVPTLSQIIIRRLGSSNMEQKVIAGNALGELIKKAGEGVLSTLLPSLEEGLATSTDVDTKQGICIALRELIVSTSEESLESFEKVLMSVVRTALVDKNEDVREAAAEAFDALQQSLGKRVVDQVLPDLLHLLRDEREAEQALAALLTLLTETTRANIILPNLIPTLLSRPISAFNAKALASLAEVAGPATTRRLPTILNTLLDEIISTKDEDLRAELGDTFDTILISVDEDDSLNTAMSVMLTLMKHEDHRRRAKAASHLAKFFSNTEIDISQYYPELIRVLLISFDDNDQHVVKASWEALNQLTSHMRKEVMEALVIPTRQVLRQVGVAGANLPGFCLPKGIGAVFPIFLQGLLNGNPDQRVQSALAIGDIIDRTSPEALRPYVTHITGPLIRVVSERSADLKSAVFLSLNKLLEKIPLFVKPFLPQLQRTFARGLADTSSEMLRTRAAKGLGILITLTPRVDPLVSELVTGSKTPDAGVKNAMLRALHEVVSKAGGSLSDTSKQSILDVINEDSGERDDVMHITTARLLGALVKHLQPSMALHLIKTSVLTTHFTHSSVLALNAILVESPTILTENFATETPSIICQGIKNKDVFISDNSVFAAGKYLLSDAVPRDPETDKSIFEALASVIQPGGPSDTRRVALVVLRTLSRLEPDLVQPYLPLLVPPVFAGVRDPVIPVKLGAEATFLNLFRVEESETAIFDAYMKGPGADLPPGPKRSIQDYFKRVALRLAGQARQRKEAEGGQGGLGLSSDEADDEKEVWSVGKLDLGDSFGED